MLLCRKLIAVTFERISEYATGKIRVRAITLPIKECPWLNPVKIAIPLLNCRILRYI